MSKERKALAQEIEELRQELDKLISTGHTLQDEHVLRISKRLDELIVRYSE